MLLMGVRRGIELAYRESPAIAAVLFIIVTLGTAAGFVAGYLVARPTDACPTPASVIWDNGNQGHNAYDSDTLTVHLEPCSTLVVTSGHRAGPDRNECGYQGDQMCVVAFRATRAMDVSVTMLDPGHTWYGVTKADAEAALADKRPQFFAPPNCAGGGCSFASIYRYLDGTAVKPEVWRP